MNSAFLHDLGGHVVADQNGVETALLKLPGSESGALQKGTGFVDEDLKVPALLGGGEKHGQSGSVIRRRQAAGIAVRQHSLAFLNQGGARFANGTAHSPIFL